MVFFESLDEKIETLVQPFLSDRGIELVDLRTRRQKRDVVIEILVDKPSGGITIDECAELNKKIGDAIETADLIADRYILDVSSPGLDRPLKTLKDFGRVKGRAVHFFLSEPVGSRIEYIGTGERIDGEDILVDIGSAEVRIPIGKINKGKQIIEEWD